MLASLGRSGPVSPVWQCLMCLHAIRLLTASILLLLLQSKPTLTKGALAVGALGAAAVVLFNEVEIVLELLGVAAAGQFVARKLLFAKDRDQTVDQIKYALLLVHSNMQNNIANSVSP